VIGEVIQRIGSVSVDTVLGSGHALVLLWKMLRRLFNPKHPAREFRAMVVQMYDHGVKAVPVVALVAVFTGMIVSLQAGVEVKAFGQESLVGRIVAASMFREMGPFITAIILTATAGSACAAEIGTMRVSEEVDALEMMGIDPIRYLVLPRVIALGLMCFGLTILTDCFGTLGGAVVARSQLGVPYGQYFEGVQRTLESDHILGFLSKHVYSGLFKSFVFGILIGVVGCSQGLRTTGGALGVGRAVRRAVVASVVLILVLGYYMTWFFYGV
jgi:phospholipid/cholesterol/gamma-HCH transport system permease protein